MIPIGLSTAQVAFATWRAGALPNLDRMDDQELGTAYQILSALLRDVEHTHAEVRELVIRRVMATKDRPS